MVLLYRGVNCMCLFKCNLNFGLFKFPEVGHMNFYVGKQAFCPTSSLIPASDKKSVNSGYLNNDAVRCEVLEVNADNERLVCGMKGVTLPPNSDYSSRLGLIHSDDFPEMYK
jgi:hypothetical protein